MATRSNRHLGARLFERAALLALALPLLCAGCGDRACFEWTEQEGACPAQAEALPFFQETQCGFSDIKSVDSDGEYDDNACCYDITKYPRDEERIFICE